MRLHTTADLPQYWDSLVSLEGRHYGPHYVPAAERILGQWHPNHFFFCSFATDGAGQITSVVTLVAFPQKSFERILSPAQDVGPKALDAYTPLDVGFSSPVLYIASMIISDRSQTPFLMKNLAREISAASRDYAVRFNDCVSISMNKRSEFLLKRYNFEPIGSCRSHATVWRSTPARSPLLGMLVG